MFLLTMLAFGVTWPLDAATGKVVKVLPHFLDHKGRHTLSPSLFDRDAYQKKLRDNPELQSAMRFDILWRSRGEEGTKLKLRLEIRGVAEGNLSKQVTLEREVDWAATSRWNSLTLAGESFKTIGEVTAWRVTLWDGESLLGEKKSFLW